MAKMNLFNSVKLMKPKKNKFDLSHDVKMSGKMGLLYPTMALPAVPGDSFNIGCESLLRFAPLVAPVMHRMDVSMHYFFVPNRIIWDNWENYITNTPINEEGDLPRHPFVNLEKDGGNYSQLMDYFGIAKPSGYPNNIEISALPFAAYQKIYNEYYRDQNLISPVADYCVDGDNTSHLNFEIQRRAWQHDYFTASLPFAQKGAAVDLPLGTITTPYARIEGTGGFDVPNTSGGNYAVDPAPTPLANGLYAPSQTAEVEPTTINDLRRAFRLQEWLERAARGGSRYTENILNFFGVKSQDARLQRPEYITGTKSPVIISEVLNTTGTEDAPQGNMAGHGISVTGGKYGNYYCQEHGYIIGIMSVMPQTAYQQGINKDFLKIQDPFEYYWPQFAHIGEQEVTNLEVYAKTNTPNGTFGYVPRYAEYKFQQNRVAGEFRDSLDFWHLGRIFADEPFLNKEFIECNPSTRIFAVTDPTVDNLYCQIYHKISAMRPMPKFGTPSF